MKRLLFSLPILFSPAAFSSADDVNCSQTSQQLNGHFVKDFKKVFNADTPFKTMEPFFKEMCEAGKVDANNQFRAGKYNITSASMGVDLQASMKMGNVNDNYKPMVKQYASVAYMYGYVNWFVN
ncbi:MAG: hypothetical protein RSG77_11610 [Hafnia sp.]